MFVGIHGMLLKEVGVGVVIEKLKQGGCGLEGL